jgi:hypothetical protein
MNNQLPFLAELRLKSQQDIKRRIFETADSANAKLCTLGGAIAEECGALPLYGPTKGEKRAQEKVDLEYGGDWYELKDAVRMTIVAPTQVGMDKVRDAMRRTCVASNGYGLIKDAQTRPEMDPCGYSGHNFVIRLPGGRTGEIQVNIVAMMYGKMRKARFVETEGLGQEKYQECNARYRVEGGLGHALYEVYRVAPASPKGQQAAQISRDYYNRLRGELVLPGEDPLKESIAAFRKAYPGALPA